MFQRQNVVHVDLTNDDPQSFRSSASDAHGRSKDTAIEISDASSQKLETNGGRLESTPSRKGISFWSRPYFGFRSPNSNWTPKGAQSGNVAPSVNGLSKEQNVIDLSVDDGDDDDGPTASIKRGSKVGSSNISGTPTQAESAARKLSSNFSQEPIGNKRSRGHDDDIDLQPSAKRPVLDKHVSDGPFYSRKASYPLETATAQDPKKLPSVSSTVQTPAAKVANFRRLMQSKKPTVAYQTQSTTLSETRRDSNLEQASAHTIQPISAAGGRSLYIGNLPLAITERELKDFLKDYLMYVIRELLPGGLVRI